MGDSGGVPPPHQNTALLLKGEKRGVGVTQKIMRIFLIKLNCDLFQYPQSLR